MNEDRSFLRRWSQRKRAIAEGRPIDAEQTGPSENAAPTRGSAAQTVAEAEALPTVDLTALPPLESITAETDIRGFLAPGIPTELRHAALRRVWSADASIRDFIGLTENDWDVLAPAAAAGVEPLAVTDAMRRFVDTLFSRGEARDGDAAPENVGQSLPATAELDTSAGRTALPAEHDGESDRAALPLNDSRGAAGQSHDAAQQIDGAAQDRRNDHTACELARPFRHGGALPR